MRVLGLVVAAIITAIGFSVLVSSCNSSTPNNSTATPHQDPDYVENFNAKDIAEQAVRERLKAPSTANFVEAVAAKNKKGDWDVYGSVDSQNSYGAMLRSDYHCTVRQIGNKWQLLKIKIW